MAAEMMKRLFKTFVVVALAGAGAAVALPAAAYVVGHDCTGDAPSAASSGQGFTFSATCDTSTGQTLPAGTPITFSQTSGPTAALTATREMAGIAYRLMATTCVATFNPPSTVVDANGHASTTITLPPNCPGQYVLTATASTGATVSVTVSEAGGFPNTAADQNAPRGAALGTAALAALVLVGAGAFGAVMVRARRG